MSRRRARFRYQSNRPAVDAALERGIRNGLRDAGMVWHGDVVRVTPVATGLLRASIAWAVNEPRMHSGHAVGLDGKSVSSEYRVRAPHHTVQVGTNVHYALWVHENLQAHHPVGDAKFIETPLREGQDVYTGLIRKAIQEAMA